MRTARMPASRDLAPLADVADGERRDGPPELVIRRKHPVIAMPVLPRRRHEVGEPVEELKRRELCRISTTNWAGLRCDRRFDGRAVASRTSPTRPSYLTTFGVWHLFLASNASP